MVVLLTLSNEYIASNFDDTICKLDYDEDSGIVACLGARNRGSFINNLPLF